MVHEVDVLVFEMNNFNRASIISRLPPISFLLLFIISTSLWSVNINGATHWRLEDGELNVIRETQEDIFAKDPLFQILTSSTINSPAKESDNISSDMATLDTDGEESELLHKEDESESSSRALVLTTTAASKFQSSILTCGDPANKTSIDHLSGVADRFLHPPYPEPEVALLFRKSEFESVKMDVIESNLLDALKTKENELVLFNQVANFLRITGDTYHAIECFRKVLQMAKSNSDALLNLARILFNLRYINDAIYLAELSLDHHNPQINTWLQHYALGEFFELNGEYERALSHFQMALDQNPAFHPAMLSIRKLAKAPLKNPTHFYTVCVIVLLCVFLLIYLYYYIVKDSSSKRKDAFYNNNALDNNNTTSFSWRPKKPGFIRR